VKLIAPAVLQPIMGTQISFEDWNQLVSLTESMSSIGLALQQGVTNALPPIQPVQAAPVSGVLEINIGGPDTDHPQWTLCQGLLCASVGDPPGTQVTLTVPANSTGETRVDAICCQPDYPQVDTASRKVEQPGGSTPTQDIPIVIQGLAFQYVEGPDGGGNPTIPTGWEVFAYVNVPDSATSIVDGDIDVQFPYMNPNAFTVTTTSTTVPAEGSQVTVNVNDTSVWKELDLAYIVGPHSDNGFLAQIVSGGVDGNANTLTVENLNTAINGSGTMPIGALVVPAGIAPVVCSMTVTDIPANIGDSFTIDMSSTGQYTPGSYGLITGRVHGKGAYFLVTNQNSATQLQCTLIGIAQGGPSLLGSTLLPGSTINSCAPPGIIEEDQDNGGFLNPTQPLRVKKGTVTITSGAPVDVTFAGSGGANFFSSSSYEIVLTCKGSAGVSAPYYTSKSAGGFTVNATGTGDIGWIAMGY